MLGRADNLSREVGETKGDRRDSRCLLLHPGRISQRSTHLRWTDHRPIREIRCFETGPSSKTVPWSRLFYS
jgi:hypothetical protein